MGVANPFAFLLSIFVVGLIVLYLWERNQRRLDIPSMLLWHSVPESVVRRSRFQPDRLFWFQLAALVALILGLANPYSPFASDQPNQRTVLVVDLSASMQSLEGDTTRLELARSAATRVIKAAPAGGEMMLIHAARQPRVAVGYTRDPISVLQALAETSATDTATKLEPALAIAQRAIDQADGNTRVHVFTDVPEESIDRRWRHGMTWWPVGTSDTNLAITGFDVTQGVLQDHQSATVRVTLHNFSSQQHHGSLSLSIAGRSFAQRLFTLGAHQSSSFGFTDLPGAGLVEARLTENDALALDNRALSWVRPWSPVRIALLTHDPRLAQTLATIAEATAAIEIDAVDPAVPPKWSDFDVAVLQGESADPLPDLPTLQFGGGGTGEASTERLEVFDWQERHPVLRGIAPRQFRAFHRAELGEPPSWGEAVLQTRNQGTESPLLVVGTPDRRRAWLAIDPASENILRTDREPALLLVLNLLDWLASGDREVSVVKTGDSVRLDGDADSPAQIIAPDGNLLEVAAGSDRGLPLERAGVYRIREGGRERTILANFRDAAESDIGRVSTNSPKPEPQPQATTEASKRSGLGLWLYLLAAAALAAEWLVAARMT